ELTQAVEKRRQPLLLVVGNIAVALDQFVYLLALAVPPEREAIARADKDLVQAVAALQRQDALVDIGKPLPLLLLFELQVQHAISLVGIELWARHFCLVHYFGSSFHFVVWARFDNPDPQPIVQVAGQKAPRPHGKTRPFHAEQTPLGRGVVHRAKEGSTELQGDPPSPFFRADHLTRTTPGIQFTSTIFRLGRHPTTVRSPVPCLRQRPRDVGRVAVASPRDQHTVSIFPHRSDSRPGG